MKNNRTFLEKLLDGAEVKWIPLGDVADYEQPTKYLVNSTVYNDNYPIPVLTAGKTFILGYTNEDEGIYFASKSPVIIFDDFTTANKWVDFDFKAKSSAMKMITSKNEKFALLKYIYYWLNTLPNNQIDGDHKRQWISNYANKLIPIPPLSVQTEIVKILDTLTALTSELTSELILRRKQYEYYREKLLSHNDSENLSQQKVDKDKLFSTSNIQWLHLNEIYKFQYGIGNKIPTIGGEYPVYGSNGIVGSHNEYNSEDAPVIGHIGAYAGIVNWAEGKHFVTYNGIICNKINDNVNSRYAYYLLLSQNFIDKANKASQPFISYDILNKCIVPVPPIEEQHRIVSILDKFETLTNSITEGLPLAIEQSQNRYEYYRELLLNFS
ncbi:restriction endonuclease subunit S [uncultured Haemophilus sp.]|jgi:type I restriction enzyme S subunit|uniref:restriction endonuclease subunit S n=1 Tax=uncultured Haemophilus sp. TaxID=237779 RepID=UPI0026139CB3|nr:restriction endonuclease subunit S [uncultured Haemophilus sp.]